MLTANVKAKEHLTCFNIDDIIETLLDSECYQFNKNFQFSEKFVRKICEKAKAILESQPIVLDLKGPIKIIGDIFGQFGDFCNLLELGGFPPKTKYLFLGNYVDRSQNGLECITLLLSYKIKYPDKIFFLRGNHECELANRKYGFFDECRRRTNSLVVYETYLEIFTWLPVAAVIGKKFFCVHGGLSKQLNGMDDIRSIRRPCDVPKFGLLCDMLWSDPDKNVTGFKNNVSRGQSVVFGMDAVEKFLLKNKFDKIIRSHSVLQNGYELMFDGRVCTIFSAPNYMEKNNDAVIMVLNENYEISMQLLKGKVDGKCKNPEVLSDFPSSVK